MGHYSTSVKVTVSSDQIGWIINNTFPAKLIAAYYLFPQLREGKSEMRIPCICYFWTIHKEDCAVENLPHDVYCES